MLKKISINDVRVGMFVQEVCGSWLDTPFWQKSFIVDTPVKLQTLKGSGIQEVWIDTAEGLDVIPNTRARTKEEETKKVDNVLLSTVQPQQKIQHVPFHEEIDHARLIHTKAKTAVAAIFHDVLKGNVPEISKAAGLVDDIILSISRNPGAFLTLSQLKSREEYFYQHSVAVCGLMIALGKQLDIQGDMLHDLGMAGLLHDIGNLQISDKILRKPRELTEEEFKIMKTHPQLGLKILQAVPAISKVILDVCLHHHERMDGAGYPRRLSGDALSLPARMGAVCEIYDSIVSDRHYKAGMAPAIAIRKMVEWQEGHYDLKVFHAFIKAVGVYPAGTLVKLTSGRLAVVMDQSAKSLLTPIVKVFFSTRINAPVFPELLDLSKVQDSIVSAENPAKLKLNVRTIMGI